MVNAYNFGSQGVILGDIDFASVQQQALLTVLVHQVVLKMRWSELV